MADMASEPYQTLYATAAAFLNDYSVSSRENDISLLSASLTPDCQRSFGPRAWMNTLPGLSRAASNTEYEESVRLQMLETFDLLVRQGQGGVVVDEQQKTATVHAEFYLFEKGSGTKSREVGSEKYLVEFVFTLWMTETGDKIKRVLQFIDAAGVKAVMDSEAGVSEHLRKHVG